jgi:hypothetical protein
MQGQPDSRGHVLDTKSAAAADAFNKGMHSFVGWRTDTFDHLDAAITADPEFALAKLTKGWILQTARSAAFKPVIDDLVKAATPLIDSTDDRARAYCDSLGAAANGRGVEAASIMEAMLVRYPTDLLAHRLVQFEMFWNGRSAWMREIAERAAPHWRSDMTDFGCFLSVRSFSSEEAGDYDLADRFGREAIEIDPCDCWGAHAIAHVLVMQGKVDDGVAWLEGLSGNWDGANQMGHHLWWHLCLFLLERGEHDRILDLLSTRIRNPEAPLVKAVPDATIDLQNVASLLMRLELRGVDIGDRWHIMADVCAGRIHNHANSFSNAHDMMVLAGCGRFDLADKLLDSMRAFVAAGESNLATSHSAAGIAVCEAVLAHRRGDYARVIELMAPVRHDMHLMGGSHAQRDIFYQILVDAARRAGRADLIPLYFADISRIGFDLVDQRTLYRDAAA